VTDISAYADLRVKYRFESILNIFLIPQCTCIVLILKYFAKYLSTYIKYFQVLQILYVVCILWMCKENSKMVNKSNATIYPKSFNRENG